MSIHAQMHEACILQLKTYIEMRQMNAPDTPFFKFFKSLGGNITRINCTLSENTFFVFVLPKVYTSGIILRDYGARLIPIKK